jgi:transcription initiation factor TFIIA large subunit
VIASHVAEFESPPPQVPSATHPAHQHFPSHPMHLMQNHAHYGTTHNPYGSTVKSEPVDNRYMLSPPSSIPYTLPPLPGPNINGSRALPPPVALTHPGGQTGIISFPRITQSQPASASPSSRPYPPPTQRIPQVDGPSDSSGEEDSSSPPPGAFAPRTSHPSLPQPPAPSQSQPGSQDSEAINSDLDDSDTEGEEDDEEGAAGETDIVFCTYDKVTKP